MSGTDTIYAVRYLLIQGSCKVKYNFPMHGVRRKIFALPLSRVYTILIPVEKVENILLKLSRRKKSRLRQVWLQVSTIENYQVIQCKRAENENVKYCKMSTVHKPAVVTFVQTQRIQKLREDP